MAFIETVWVDEFYRMRRQNFSFVPGLNSVIGGSMTGKSTLAAALQFVLMGDEEPRPGFNFNVSVRFAKPDGTHLVFTRYKGSEVDHPEYQIDFKEASLERYKEHLRDVGIYTDILQYIVNRTWSDKDWTKERDAEELAKIVKLSDSRMMEMKENLRELRQDYRNLKRDLENGRVINVSLKKLELNDLKREKSEIAAERSAHFEMAVLPDFVQTASKNFGIIYRSPDYSLSIKADEDASPMVALSLTLHTSETQISIEPSPGEFVRVNLALFFTLIQKRSASVIIFDELEDKVHCDDLLKLAQGIQFFGAHFQIIVLCRDFPDQVGPQKILRYTF